MQTERNQPNDSPRSSFGSLFRDLGMSAKNMIRSEVDLALAELKENVKEVGKHSAQAAVFGALAALSVLPFLAFLVIGLGDLLDGRYWLSSLIVSLVCAFGGGIPAYAAFKRLKAQDLSLNRTKQQFDHQKRVVQDQVENLKDVTNATLRRAV